MVGILEVEDWWRHNGCWDREQASGIPYNPEDSVQAYLEETDKWWHSLSIEERKQSYYEFFEEV